MTIGTGGAKLLKWHVMLWLGVALGGCGTRQAVEKESPSCEALRNVPRASNSCLEAECDWVWVTQAGLSTASIFNPEDVRLDGVSGVSVLVYDEHWRVFGDVALRVDAATAEHLDGLVVDCAESEPVARPFAALPLAPRVPQNSGFTQLAHASAMELGFPSAHRGSDLTSLDAETLVLALGSGGLSVVDSRGVNAGELRGVAHIPASPGEDFNDVVAAKGRYVFAASKSRGVVVWDLLDPTVPAFVVDGFPERAPKDGHNLLLRGDTLYLAQAPAVGTGALTAFDVSDPTAPIELWRFVPDAGHDVHDVTVLDDTLYVSSLRGGLYVLRNHSDERGNQSVEVVAREAIESAHGVALLARDGTVDRFVVSSERLGGELLLGTFDPYTVPPALSFERAAEPFAALPAGDGTVQVSASPHNVECMDAVCHVAHYQLGLRVLDWNRPGGSATLPVASFSTWHPSAEGERDWLRGASGVLLTSSVVYVLDTQNGLFALQRTRDD